MTKSEKSKLIADIDCHKCERHITNGGSCKDTLPKFCSLFKAAGKEDLK